MSGLEELQESLGRGRLGETWFVQTGGGRSLVIKRLRLPEGDAGDVADAIRAVAGVRHPSLVPIVEVTGEPEAVWVRSELVPGVPLQRLLVVAVITPPQAALIARGILEGLGALNAAGLPHGDLHAGNVHVGPAGEVWLSDGGLRPLLERRSSSPAPDAGADWRAVDAAAVGALVTAMAGDERRRGPAWRAADAQDLLAAGESDPERRSTDALDALQRQTLVVLPEAGHERVAGELGALVHAVSLRSAPRPMPVVAGQLVPPPRSRLRIPQLSRRARRRALAGAAVAAIALTSLWLGWRLVAFQHKLPARPPTIHAREDGRLEAMALPGRPACPPLHAEGEAPRGVGG